MGRSSNVAEPPHSWAAPDVRGPGTDSGQMGLAPAPEKKSGSRRLLLLTIKFLILSSENVFYKYLISCFLREQEFFWGLS